MSTPTKSQNATNCGSEGLFQSSGLIRHKDDRMNSLYIANFLEERISFQLDLQKMNPVTLREFCYVLHKIELKEKNPAHMC